MLSKFLFHFNNGVTKALKKVTTVNFHSKIIEFEKLENTTGKLCKIVSVLINACFNFFNIILNYH